MGFNSGFKGLIFKLLDGRLEDKRFYTERQQAFPDSKLILISSWIDFDLLRLYPIIWTLYPFKGTIVNLYFMTSYCILFSTHDHVLSLLPFTSRPVSILATTKTSVFFFLYIVKASCQYINIISIKQNLVCSI